ncbi:hypothetical protein JKG47_00050 [Acidithiobacillus sp. MC6.1]|nr:hypothetical protein [Acidithiobacillus sp. MC6.1]
MKQHRWFLFLGIGGCLAWPPLAAGVPITRQAHVPQVELAISGNGQLSVAQSALQAEHQGQCVSQKADTFQAQQQIGENGRQLLPQAPTMQGRVCPGTAFVP